MSRFLATAVFTLGVHLSHTVADEIGAVNTSPMTTVKIEQAFPKLRFRRPLLLTFAPDGSDRVFVASQFGVVHVFQNDERAATAPEFLNIESRVVYKKEENEEGFLGLAFHPRYRENGQFFVYYTTTDAPHTSVISRFRVSQNDPNRADPESEEEILRIKQPYWNHNGGTIIFGPDGYLYIGLGDGGKANDPMENGQNRGTLLGSMLRIDIDRKDEGLQYAIPPDNPFVDAKPAGRETSVRPEIWAYGLRNVWRMAFDRQTGVLWAGDVGQNTWEEIDLIVRGGNYGWNLREGMHPFPSPDDPGLQNRPTFDSRSKDKQLIEPIWEFHHTVGLSVTGGHVYRGRDVPELKGYYLYADYVSGQVWALKYDERQKRVTDNRPIGDNKLPVMSFGEDAQGESYFMTDGGRVFWLRRAKTRAGTQAKTRAGSGAR